MIIRIFKIYCFLLLVLLKSQAQETISDRHIKVAMRSIGDRMLINSADHSSRVLPIIKDGDRFKISFESEFQFKPNELVQTVRGVVNEAKVAKHYIVEMEQTETKEVVYSFEINSSTQTDLIPCSGRTQPRGHYALYFIILDSPINGASAWMFNGLSWMSSHGVIVLLLFGTVLLVGLFYHFRRRPSSEADIDLISIGNYQLDKRRMMLFYGSEKVELSSREVDLLFLLHSGQNEAIGREHILKIVWGDEGHYIGRTLDVFVSKLRKRLSADKNIKIINVRGYGYKLVC